MKMKFALVNGERLDAQPGFKGNSPLCERPAVSKCGKIRLWHWAHLGKLECDPWWKNKTDWHIDWQNKFPKPWQEVPHEAPDGEKHFADVKTDLGWVLEFQNSVIKPEERNSRNDFYKRIIWVVNGKRRKNDLNKFLEVVKNGAVQLNPKIPILKIRGFWDESALLRDWANITVPVFFDFGDASDLWYLLPKSVDGLPDVIKFSRNYFLELFLNGAQKVNDLNFWFPDYNSDSKPKPQPQPTNQPPPQIQINPNSLQAYVQRKIAWENRFRGRL